MSKDLAGDIANAIALIDGHCAQHGRDMYGDCLGLREAESVLRQCAAALKKAEPPKPAPEPAKPEPAKEDAVKLAAQVKARGSA